jgi:calcium-dependent protein kinase
MRHVSLSAKTLITQMLCYNSSQRLDAKAALASDWILKNTKWNRKEDLHAISPSQQHSVLRNLKNFRAESKLQEAILFYMITHLSNQQEKEDLYNQFLEIDEEGTGTITKKNLIDIYYKTGKDPNEAVKIAESIMKNADFCGEGDVNFSEFVAACLDKRKFLCDERLAMGFKMFAGIDEDFITFGKFKEIFKRGCFAELDEDVWKFLINDFLYKEGVCGEGEEDFRISFATFKKIMRTFEKSEVMTMSLTISKTMGKIFLGLMDRHAVDYGWNTVVLSLRESLRVWFLAIGLNFGIFSVGLWGTGPCLDCDSNYLVCRWVIV